MEEEEEIKDKEIDLEQMSYRELLKLEKSGLLKGLKLLECRIRLNKLLTIPRYQLKFNYD